MKKIRIRLGIFGRDPNSIEGGLLETLGYKPLTESVPSTFVEAPEHLGDTCLTELKQFFTNAIIINKDEETNKHDDTDELP